MIKALIQFLLLLSVVIVLGLSAQGVVVEAQPADTSQSVSTADATPVKKLAPLTPEQEAALVEVRTVLSEAWEVAAHIEMPSSLFTKQVTIKALGEVKQKLLWSIVDAQLQAGDFSNPASSYDLQGAVIDQIQYGHLQEAVQTATHETFSFSAGTLVILKLLSDARDLAGAMQVAEAQVRGRRYSGAERRQYEAELMAYMARRQAEAGKPEARETLARALDAIRSNKNAPYQSAPYFQHGGLVAVGCAQAAMGDHAQGEESMRQAIKAAVALPREEYDGQKGWIVSLIGQAAAESGLHKVSQEAFQESLRLARHIPDSAARTKVMAKVAVSQLQSGDRTEGQRMLEEATTFAESLPDHQERRRASAAIVVQHIETGDLKGAAAIAEQMRRRAETLPDAKERAADLKAIRWWDAKLLPPQVALERAYAIQGDDQAQADALASATFILVNRTESVATPEMLQRMSQAAATLLAKPLPDDRKKADHYLFSIARVQAVADGASQALETVARIKNSNNENTRYVMLVSLLTQKRDAAGAKQVADAFKDEWLPWDGTATALREVGRVQVQSRDASEAVQWAQQQKNPYAKAEILLGVGLGIMEREGIYSFRRQLPANVAIKNGARDTLTLGCSSL